jgi:glycosyltransferase involved in cell wall biosynthesis
MPRLTRRGDAPGSYPRAVPPDVLESTGAASRRAPRVRGLSAILPAYNEAENIAPMVESTLRVLPDLADDWEILIVDDGSADETGEVASRLVDEHGPNVRLLSHPANRGYGAAIRTGLQHARHELIFYTDSDRQFDVAELIYFLPMMDDHDLVIGFRVYRYDAAFRSVISWGYNRLVAVLFRAHVRDVDCAFKVMRAEVRDKVQLETDDFFIDTELVARARKWNFRIGEKGVRHYPRVAGETTVAPGDIPRTLRTVARMWRRIYLPTRGHRAEAEEISTRVNATEYLPSGTESS